MNWFFSKMPATRARTCAMRKASVRPGHSVVKATVLQAVVTTLTSGGGGAPVAPPGADPAAGGLPDGQPHNRLLSRPRATPDRKVLRVGRALGRGRLASMQELSIERFKNTGTRAQAVVQAANGGGVGSHACQRKVGVRPSLISV